MNRLDNETDMRTIYNACKKVFNGEISNKAALEELRGKTPSSDSSLEMYFDIYQCMRKGKCYKMGTSAPFTRFLIENIGKDEGKEALIAALTAAKKNSEYRKICNNAQPGIEKVVREILTSKKMNLKYEDLESYEDSGKRQEKKQSPKIKKEIVKSGNNTLHLKIKLGDLIFEVEGPEKEVIRQEEIFIKNIYPHAIKSAHKAKENTKDSTKASVIKKDISVGKKLSKKYSYIEKIKNNMDFKAKMIPLMYLATKFKLQSEFTVLEIQQLIYDAISIPVEKRQIEDIIKRRPDWFKVINSRPKKYALEDIGINYAKNIIRD